MLGPIFNREFVTVPRRDRHFTSRVAALGLLWVIGITAWQATVGFTADAQLGETARFGLLLFQIVCFVQLTLLLFFSALSAASTVSQEKDRRTFILLLLTDMRDYEIVLGKMLGSLLPIGVLFAVTVPFFAFILLLGGVSGEQVTQAVLVLASTAIASGSLGGLIALWRERTFQALALAVLALVFYLFLVEGIGLAVRLVTNDESSMVTSWLDPFVAMRYVVEPPVEEPALHPAYGFTISMLALSAALNGFGIWKLRKWNPSGEPVQQREAADDKDDDAEKRAKAHAAPGVARQVWANPILWREIRTLAYGRRPLLVKFAYGIVIALICYFAFGQVSSSQDRPAFAAAYGLVPAVVLSLLLVSAQAVTSITSERDGKALDLLLVTDISPKEFVFGKLGGVLYNTKEFIIPPLLMAIYYAIQGALAYTQEDEIAFLRNLGPLICVLGSILILIGFVMILGLHVALRIDFAAGAVKYLSDLEPVALEESGTDPEHYQKDKNLDRQPIHLLTDPATGRADMFPKGLTIKAKTVLTYELKGAYKTFRALAGVDADKQNEAPSQVKITIDDGMAVLWSGVIKKGDKPKDLNLSVQNVDRLKITVESDGSVTDLGNQVSFANARVLK